MVAATEEVLDPGAADTDGFRQEMQYAGNGSIASTRSTHIEREFDTPTELFLCVFLRTNVAKTVIMACQPFRALGGHSADAYRLRMAGEGQT